MNYKEIFETSLKTTGMIAGAVGGTGSLIYLYAKSGMTMESFNQPEGGLAFGLQVLL